MSRDKKPDQERVKDILRDMPEVSADPHFESDLRRRFLEMAGTQSSSGASPSFMRRWRFPLAAAILIAAAMTLAFWGTQTPDLELVSVSGKGIIYIGDVSFEVNESSTLPEDFADRIGSEELKTQGAVEVTLKCGNQWLAVITGDTVATLPDAFGRWTSKSSQGSIESGEIRFVTGSGFVGGALAYETDEASVQITGTTFAIIRNDIGTCVCVLNGSVHVASKVQSSAQDIPEGYRHIVSKSGEPPRTEDLEGMERMKLDMLQGQAVELIR